MDPGRALRHGGSVSDGADCDDTRSPGADSARVVRDIGKLWGAVREMRAWVEGKLRELEIALIGIDGGNGLRGNIQKNTERIDSLEHQVVAGIEWGTRLWDVERHKPGGCIGKLAVEELEARLLLDAESREKEVIETRRTRYAMLTGLGVALITSIAPIIMAWTK